MRAPSRCSLMEDIASAAFRSRLSKLKKITQRVIVLELKGLVEGDGVRVPKLERYDASGVTRKNRSDSEYY
jgi:hypothetical protein